MNTLVSICIPTYNGEAFLEEAINSALNQTYKNIEVIISDDSSTDKTLEIVKTFAESATIPFYVHKHSPNGIGANWNYSIEKANGKYIKFLFQDDVLEPTCVEKMVDLMEANNDVGLVACKRDFIVEASYVSKETEKWLQKYNDLQKDICLNNNKEVIFLKKNIFKHPAFFISPYNKIGEPSVYMFSKSVFNTVGDFREDLKQSLDYEFCYRILKNQKIAILNEKLVKFRLHNMQATNVNRQNNYDDHSNYMQIIYKDYFWLISTKQKLILLKERYKLVSVLFKLKSKLKL